MPPKRRRRFQGLYYHSSPPKVLPMNGQISNENGRRRRDNDDFSVKLSTIRIWMHEKDIGKLTRILWAGQGQRLRQQASTNNKVKRFLTAVPYVMNSIKDVHQAVIDNSLETLQAKLEPPVPPALVTCRDANGLNLIHKAAGLGHATILEYLITTWPDGVHETDITGKTPLHWAASAKNNMRCYTLLTQAGCDEEAVDYKMKTPSFYRHKPHDIERAFLTYVPEAPRVSPDVLTDWEALSDDSGDGKKLDIKIPEMNGFGRHSNAESNENTSEAEMTEGVSGLEDEDMSKDDDVGALDESDAIIEHEDEAEAEEPEPEIENPPENEEEPEKEQEQEPDEEPPAINEDNEDPEEEKEETQDEPDKEEEEEPQDEKQQTLNDTTTSPTKDLEAEHESESKDVKANEESNETDGQEHKDSDASSEEKDSESAIEADKEKDEKEQEEDEEESKTVGETLEVIKEELKDNVKYLANKVKNVFTYNEDKNDESENEEEKGKDNENENENDAHQNEKEENKIKETGKNENVNENNVEEKKIEENNIEEKNVEERNNIEEKNVEEENVKNTEDQEKSKNSKDHEDDSESKITANSKEVKNPEKKETEDIKKDIEITDNAKEDPSKQDNENNSDEILSKDDKNKTESENKSPEKIDKNLNEIKDQAQKLTTAIVSTLETTTKEALKNENNKTEEDENNNQTKAIENINNIQTEITGKDIDKINKTLEEYTNKDIEVLKEKQQDIENNIKEVADNVKESIEEKQQELEQTADSVKESIEEKQTYLGDKLEEITDSVKDNIKDMASKVKGIFTTASSEEKLENESNDVIVHSESPTKQMKNTKVESESSDETADEDEATQAEEVNDEVEEVNPEANDADDEQANDDDDHDKDNAEKPEVEERDGEESPTSSLAIEGFVQGESEDNTVQSQTAAYVHGDEDTRIQNIIASGDMEQLAQIVLNGDGQKLLNVEATEPEIQAFLKNVPNYMTKIRRVHEASRGGSLLNLQQALDRRKFAIAKDEISPNGATPLHVAVLFGHSDIVRYLSARFPETTSITDNDGRTALHYAAVIKDNGHFYNVLLQLGANPKAVDKMGHTPEEYMNDESLKDTLSYGLLLKNFGAEEVEAQLLSDQGQIENHSYQENPIFKTEQGKYLADNLADPLIKALTQVAQKRPNDPLQYLTNYLQTYVTSQNPNGKTITQAAIHSGSSQTNSTALVNSKPSTPPPQPAAAQTMSQRQTARMNGHVKYGNTDEIEEDSMPQIDDFDDEDNDSDAAISKRLEERDEHGQSMLHFASARSHRKGGLIHLIEEAKADITYRDELYRTARDVALQANQLGNAKEIDRYLISLAIVGDIKPFEHFAISGYDHIIDIVDENETPIIDIAEGKGHMELVEFLRTLRPLEELREELHQMIRDNKVERVMDISNGPSGKWLIQAKNYYGRTALHIAILKESEEIVEHFIKICPEASKIGDNLERTALHYAMGTNIIEGISRILIQNGAKRTHKDLKGRQPSYYFMNKADILRLQEEEDENR